MVLEGGKAPINSWVVGGVWEGGEGGEVGGGIVGGRVHFVWYGFFTIKKCTST